MGVYEAVWTNQNEGTENQEMQAVEDQTSNEEPSSSADHWAQLQSRKETLASSGAGRIEAPPIGVPHSWS